MKLLNLALYCSLLVPLAAMSEEKGALDPWFHPGTAFGGGNETIGYTIVPLADGRILVGGDFTTFNGVERPHLVRLHEDGSLDETFHLTGGLSGGEEPAIWAIGFQPDGGLIVSGNFNTISGVARPGVARLHPDGALDMAWQPQLQWANGQTGSAIDARVQPDGRVLAWTAYGLQRLNADGSPDTTFNFTLGGFFFSRSAVSLQRDGRILVAGVLGGNNGQPIRNLVRLHPDGSLDDSFAPKPLGTGAFGVNWAYGAVEMDDRRILIFGAFDKVEGRSRRGLALLRANGRLDTSARFPGNRIFVKQARLLRDGSICVASANDQNAANQFEVAVYGQRKSRRGWKGGPWRTTLAVSLDPTANPAYDIAEDSEGRLLVVGEFTAIDGVPGIPGIARLLR